MKVLICGSRDWPRSGAIARRVAELPEGTIVIQGAAGGADHDARQAAIDRGLWVVDVPVLRCHWETHGRSAGHKRNHVMLTLAPDQVIAFQHNHSSGTQGMIDAARRVGIPTEVHSCP